MGQDDRGSARSVEARRVLDEDHYDLDKVKERIVEIPLAEPASSKGGPHEAPPAGARGPILCFVGPPGVGKTSLGQSIARAMNRKFVRISLGGVRDEAEIRGHRRTYIGSMPGRIVQALKTAGSVESRADARRDRQDLGRHPGRSGGGAARGARPRAEPRVPRHYLEIPIDLSRVLFIATANQLGTIHPALLDRMEIIPLSGYTEEEKVHIARLYSCRGSSRERA